MAEKWVSVATLRSVNAGNKRATQCGFCDNIDLNYRTARQFPPSSSSFSPPHQESRLQNPFSFPNISGASWRMLKNPEESPTHHRADVNGTINVITRGKLVRMAQMRGRSRRTGLIDSLNLTMACRLRHISTCHTFHSIFSNSPSIFHPFSLIFSLIFSFQFLFPADSIPLGAFRQLIQRPYLTGA